MKILGIDVGGSGIKGAIVDTTKGVLETKRYRIPTPKPATPKAVIQTIIEIIEHFEWEGKVGCGFPAAIVDDIVRTASNIDKSWIGVNASSEIEKRTGCKTTLVNDVDAAGFAEMKLGAGKDKKGIIFMAAFGTGIGTSIFRDGTLITNTELGHIIMENGKIAEDYAANSVREKKNLSWEKWGKRVSEYLNHIEKLFYPSLIIIGGGVSKDFNKFEEYLTVNTKVVPAEKENHAGIIGAALAARANKN
jgi:polyphosphate glucokinase